MGAPTYIDQARVRSWKGEGDPWEIQPWDSPFSYDMFLRFYLAQPREKRSLIAAYRNYNASLGRDGGSKRVISGRWRKWANGQDPWGRKLAGSKFENSLTWAERAFAFDMAEDVKRREAISKQREQWQSRELEMANKIYDRVVVMTTFPLIERIVSEDGKTITIKPADWDERTILLAAKTAADLARRGLGMPTERIETDVRIDWRKKLEAQGINAGELFNGLVASIAAAGSGRDRADDSGSDSDGGGE